MTPSDDIRDLLGRYATGSLTVEERQRLFDAALDDQALFEELAREDEVKLLLAEPGARDRMIRALEPPKRNRAWIFGVAATAALTAVVAVFLLYPAPKPRPVEVAKVTTTPTPVAQPESAPPPAASAPAKTEGTARRDVAATENSRAEPRREKTPTPSKAKAAAGTSEPADTVVVADQPAKDEAKKKEAVQVQAATTSVASPPQTVEVTAATPAPIQQFTPKQQAGFGGPRQQQMAGQARVPLPPPANSVADSKALPFGFHYSTVIPGHLSIIPAADGYLFVKSNDGTVLFGPKLSAAGIIVDLPLQSAVTSVTVTFSEGSSPVETKPTLRSEPVGDIEGLRAMAVQIKINP
jgi:hypothetical protein